MDVAQNVLQQSSVSYNHPELVHVVVVGQSMGAALVQKYDRSVLVDDDAPLA